MPAKTENTLIDIFGFAPDTTYVENWPLLASADMAWKKIEKEEGVLINEQLSRRIEVGLTEKISLSSNGQDHEFTVLGIYSDYGNSKGQVMLPISLFEKPISL